MPARPGPLRTPRKLLSLQFPPNEAQKTLAASDILSDIEPAQAARAGKRMQTDANSVSG
jgi:hypothetical protein